MYNMPPTLPFILELPQKNEKLRKYKNAISLIVQNHIYLYEHLL